MRVFGIVGLWLGLCAAGHGEDLWENEPIRYSAAVANDPGTVLERGINDGSIKIPGVTDVERVRWVLNRLNIPVESQILVFSKTSKQNNLITPWNPRALYFSENAYAAFVPGGQMEIISHDPVLGPVFHVIDLGNAETPARGYRSTSDCLSCHGTARTLDVPGVIVRSVFPDADGRPLLIHGSTQVDATTPLENRWGGYYVTGQSSLAHLGNRTYREDEAPADTKPAPPIKTLEGKIDLAHYPCATSDIVSLMVLEHQCQVYNLITAGSCRYRRMQWMGRILDPKATTSSDSIVRMAKNDAENIVDALLFRDAATMGDGVEGNDAYQKAFSKRYPVTADGDSLADFHLGGKLFKNRCSYMVYSQIFATMADGLKTAVIARLHEILDAKESVEGYDYLRTPERKRISEILSETLPGYR